MYECTSRREAELYYKDWCERIPPESDFNGFRIIAKTIKRCETEIFNYFGWSYTNAFVEGIKFDAIIRAAKAGLYG